MKNKFVKLLAISAVIFGSVSCKDEVAAIGQKAPDIAAYDLQGKEVKLYCPVEIPKYLRYIDGWDRVESDFSTDADLAIIVDTTAGLLLSKVLKTPGARHFLESREVLVIDHHTSAEPTLSFNHTLLLDEAAAASQVIYNLAESSHWHINKQAAKAMLTALLSDTLGLTTQNVNSKVYSTAAKLSDLGASPAEIEEKRRDFMKKSPKIREYKGKRLIVFHRVRQRQAFEYGCQKPERRLEEYARYLDKEDRGHHRPGSKIRCRGYRCYTQYRYTECIAGLSGKRQSIGRYEKLLQYGSIHIIQNRETRAIG